MEVIIASPLILVYKYEKLEEEKGLKGSESVATRTSFRHFPMREFQSNHSFLGVPHRWRQLYVPKMRLLSWASLGLTISLYCGLDFPTLGRSQQRDSIDFPLPLDHSLRSFSYCLMNLLTLFPPLTSHIYSPKLVVRLWLLPWLVQWEVQYRQL